MYNLKCNFNAKLNLLKIRHDKDESSVDSRIVANQSFKNVFVITSCIRNLLLCSSYSPICFSLDRVEQPLNLHNRKLPLTIHCVSLELSRG